MAQVTEQLFDAFVHLVMQHSYGERYTRDPRQAVPPDCGFVRFRKPGGALHVRWPREVSHAGGGRHGVSGVCRAQCHPDGSANEFPPRVPPHVCVAPVCRGAGGHPESVAPVETRLGRLAALTQRGRALPVEMAAYVRKLPAVHTGPVRCTSRASPHGEQIPCNARQHSRPSKQVERSLLWLGRTPCRCKFSRYCSSCVKASRMARYRRRRSRLVCSCWIVGACQRAYTIGQPLKRLV